MCDYSLMAFPNRLAVEGEELVAHRFPSGSMGLASVEDLEPKTPPNPPRRSFWAVLKEFFDPAETCKVPAVCIPPASRLALHNIDPSFQREYGVRAEEEVVFEQLTADAHTYRDAVRFVNGRRVRLQELPEGLRATVLDLNGDVPREPMPEETAELLWRRG